MPVTAETAERESVARVKNLNMLESVGEAFVD